MRAELHSWESPHIGGKMRIRRFGNSGQPILYVPGSDGDETEFERYGMPTVANAAIRDGRFQFFAIDGRASDTLWNESIPPAKRIRRYAAFERCVALEILPWIRKRTADARLFVVGVSYGAFVAANLLFKYPTQIELVCGLGGVYGMWHRLAGYHDDEVYFHTPLEYLPRLEDPRILEQIRATRGLTMFAAENDEWLDSTHQMARVCAEKQLPNHVDVWASPANHHERWWRMQLQKFLSLHASR